MESFQNPESLDKMKLIHRFYKAIGKEGKELRDVIQ